MSSECGVGDLASLAEIMCGAHTNRRGASWVEDAGGNWSHAEEGHRADKLGQAAGGALRVLTAALRLWQYSG
jgi:hypothetical protein